MIFVLAMVHLLQRKRGTNGAVQIMCVCVCERERERGCVREREREREGVCVFKTTQR